AAGRGAPGCGRSRSVSKIDNWDVITMDKARFLFSRCLRRGNSPSRRRRLGRPRVELLEDRLVPSGFTDTTAADFAAGTAGGTYVSQTGDGEVSLAPAAGAEFSGTALPSGWTGTPWSAGGTAGVSGGVLSVDGARASADALYGPGRSLE